MTFILLSQNQFENGILKVKQYNALSLMSIGTFFKGYADRYLTDFKKVYSHVITPAKEPIMLNLSRTIADAHYIAHNNTTSKAKFHVFILGMREFRMTMTQHYDAYEVLEWYDRGRELANVLTFRYFDTTSA